MPIRKAIRFSPSAIRNRTSAKGRKPKAAFTLIEILIVIVIIGILATLVIFSANKALSKGRDAKKNSDLKAFKQTMEVAKGDCVGQYWYPGYSGTANGDTHKAFGAMIDGLHTAGYKLPINASFNTPNSDYGMIVDGDPNDLVLACPGTYGQNPTIQGRLHWQATTNLENPNPSIGQAAYDSCRSIYNSIWNYQNSPTVFAVCSET